MTKIDVISGFLGAGKTTLIKKLLADALQGQQVVLIENEFGEIGIDGGFLADAGIEIREMNQGCICCSLVGDFGTALNEVLETYHPDRIIIEPSGVGKLSDVIHAIEKNREEAELELNSATTVVDVTKCKMYLANFGEFFENQVAAAGTIVLSRMDTEKATPEKVEEAIVLIRDLNADGTIITTPIDKLSGQKLLETMEGNKVDLTHGPCCCHEHHHEDDACCHGHHHEDGDCCHEHHHEDGDCCHEHHHEDGACCHEHHHEDDACCHHDHEHHHHHHDAGDVFQSWGRETFRKYTAEQIEEILRTLSEDSSYGTILRAKGMVEGEDGRWIHFDMVPGEWEVRAGAAEYTGRLCVIGAELKEDRIAELFGV